MGRESKSSGKQPKAGLRFSRIRKPVYATIFYISWFEFPTINGVWLALPLIQKFSHSTKSTTTYTNSYSPIIRLFWLDFVLLRAHLFCFILFMFSICLTDRLKTVLIDLYNSIILLHAFIILHHYTYILIMFFSCVRNVKVHFN